MKKTFNPIATAQMDNLFEQLAESNARMKNYREFKQEAKARGDEQMEAHWNSQWREAICVGSDILDEIDFLRETFERSEFSGEL